MPVRLRFGFGQPLHQPGFSRLASNLEHDRNGHGRSLRRTRHATLAMLAITAGWRRAGSDASAGNLSLLPCAQRYSIVTSRDPRALAQQGPRSFSTKPTVYHFGTGSTSSFDLEAQ